MNGEFTNASNSLPAAMESPSAPSASESGLLQTQEMSLEQLRKFAESGYLYAILDACDAPAVPPKMQDLGEQRAVSLFRGSAQEDYWAVAPYLCVVDPPTLDWIFETLWKEPWGIFALAKTDLETLRTHFRRFLVVQLSDGKSWFFRYYDPRMLKAYLPTCDESELQRFFGPLRVFGAPDPEQKLIWAAHSPYGASTNMQPGPETHVLWQIRPKQAEAQIALHQKGFHNRLAEFLQQKFTTASAMAPTELSRGVGATVRNALRYGLTTEQEVATFVVTAYLFGADFDRRIPAAGQALNSRLQGPKQKAEWLAQWARQIFNTFAEPA